MSSVTISLRNINSVVVILSDRYVTLGAHCNVPSSILTAAMLHTVIIDMHTVILIFTHSLV